MLINILLFILKNNKAPKTLHVGEHWRDFGLARPAMLPTATNETSHVLLYCTKACKLNMNINKKKITNSSPFCGQPGSFDDQKLMLDFKLQGLNK